MSGIEVAGLALGALPILIAALESYNESLDPVKSFINWERELPKFIRKLRNQHVHYAQTMRQLLEPITDEFELSEMLAEPGGQLWKDSSMAAKLGERLQESSQAYQSTIADIERIMKKIASKLDLDRAVELTRNDLEAIIAANPKKGDKFEFRKRVRFGMKKKTIQALLEELDDCNKELERYTDKSERLETIRKTSKPSFATRLQRIQSLAKNLHSSILSSWSCSCRSFHQTSLQLEQRETLYVSAVKKTDLSQGTCFVVSFSSSGGDMHPWTWQEAEIRIEEEDASATKALPVFKPKMAKSVSFGQIPPPPYSVVAESTETVAQTLIEVKDLCASIQKMHKSSPFLGLSFNSKSNLLRGVYPVDSRPEKQVPKEVVTLDDLFNHPPLVNGRPAKLSKKERYALAVTLASSTLQLASTPWFPDQWSARDICFHRTSTTPRLVDVNHPYVTSQLVETSQSNPKSRQFKNKNTILLALAIALLELYFGVSTEKHQGDEHEASDASKNIWSLCAMAYEWAESEQENLSAAFSTAVGHCLRCFNDPGASLEDPEFLQAAVESIVLPLQDELLQFLGKAAA